MYVITSLIPARTKIFKITTCRPFSVRTLTISESRYHWGQLVLSIPFDQSLTVISRLVEPLFVVGLHPIVIFNYPPGTWTSHGSWLRACPVELQWSPLLSPLVWRPTYTRSTVMVGTGHVKGHSGSRQYSQHSGPPRTWTLNLYPRC